LEKYRFEESKKNGKMQILTVLCLRKRVQNGGFNRYFGRIDEEMKFVCQRKACVRHSKMHVDQKNGACID